MQKSGQLPIARPKHTLMSPFPESTRKSIRSEIQAGLLAPGSSVSSAFPVLDQWHLCRKHPQLQRRDRNGFSPFSLFCNLNPKYLCNCCVI